MKKKIISCFMAFIMAGSLAACGNKTTQGSSTQGPSAQGPSAQGSPTQGSSAQAGSSGSGHSGAAAGQSKTGSPSVVLKLGHIQSESDLWQLGAKKFADRVSELSGGDMRVDIYPNSTLGGDRDMAEGLMMGTVDIALIAGVLSNFDDSVSILEIPYLFRSEDEFETVIYGDIGKEIADHVLSTTGIRILDYWERGPRLITSNKPINCVEDMKGLKIRIPEISAMEQVFSAWGAAATTMSWSEVYPSLQQGVIEAQENPIPFFYSGSIYEVNKYLAKTNHKFEYVTMSMSDAVYKKLTKDQQDIIMQAAREATQFENEQTLKVTEEDLKDMVDHHGVIVTEPDISGFIKIADQVAPKYAQSIGQADLYNKIEKALGR